MRREISHRIMAVGLCIAVSAWAQEPQNIAPVRPSGPALIRPYLTVTAPPVRLKNSSRLHALIRAGILYLSVQDAIALALENNVDVEIARYNPFAAAWQLERSQAGGALPGVPSGASQAGSVATGQGIAGSQAAAGVVGSGGTSSTGGVGNATVSQVGPIAQTLDPSIQESSTFTHKTTPQYDVVQSLIPVLVSNTRVYTFTYQQGFLTGGAVTASYSDHYLNENAPTDVLNPSVATNLSISFQHNLLRGFGIAVNARNINVAKINMGISDLNFRSQLVGTVAQVLNAYYALVAGYEDVKAKQSAVELARTLYANNQRQVELGAMTPLDVTTAAAQVASTSRDLVDSETNIAQQELQLKDLISRTGLADEELAHARIVPTDRIEIPAQDDLPPLQALVEKALATRPDLAAQRESEKGSEISALGTANGILPTAQAFGSESLAGLAGSPHTLNFEGFKLAPDSYFIGGTGTALGQIFRRNFPTQRIGAFAAVPLNNRQAQADFGIDQLQLRQTQIENQKSANQVGVDVLNSVTALRQARIRYQAALKNRELDQQLLDAEEKKLSLGASVPFNVIQQQRDLSAAQSSVIAAEVSYSNARVALDQTLGTILETNHVSIEEARSGRVERASTPSGTH